MISVGVAAFAAAVVTALLETVVLGLRPRPAIATSTANGAVVFFLLQRRGLERELRRARVRSVDAIDLERQRIERDLHDSAQQRLVSVRIRMDQLAHDLPNRSERATVEGLGRDVDAALGEIRSVARGGDPTPLLRLGLATALRSLAPTAPIPVSVHVDNLGRYDPDVERNIYFCCVEALQNVVKHAGPSAVARIRVVQRHDRLIFDISDSGVGFDKGHTPKGEGLINIADRAAELGGRLTVDSGPGLGTRVRGVVPVVPIPASRQGAGSDGDVAHRAFGSRART